MYDRVQLTRIWPWPQISRQDFKLQKAEFNLRNRDSRCRQLFVRLALVFCSALTGCNTAAQTAVAVEWTTATEINTAGFNLYRSERSEGPYTKINAQLIPTSPDPMIGGKYAYKDTGVVPGRTYYYQLEDVEFGGASAQHGPIVITAVAPFGAGDALMWLALVVALVMLGTALIVARRNARVLRIAVSGDKERAIRE